MACATDALHCGADPHAGFSAGRRATGDRVGNGPGWRVPSPRAGGVPGRGASAARPADRPLGPFTDRDRELVRHLAAGRSTAQIAAAMSISSNTARTRIRRVSGKLAVVGRQELVGAARTRGLV